MTEPKLLVLPDGRALSYDAHGAADAPAVLCFHGSPGSRLDFTPSSVMSTDGSGVRGRFIAVDRPGVGGSSFLEGRALTDWSADVEALADHLGLDRFAVLGYSGGGAYALAAAVGLGERVTKVALVGSTAPPAGRALDDGTALGSRVGFELTRYLGRLVEVGVVVANQALGALPDLAIMIGTAEMCAADRQLVASQEVRDNRIHTYREAARNGARGAVFDVALVAGDWGFDLHEVDSPVTVWAGADDNFVPLAQTRYLVSTIPGARLELLPHTGHTLLFSHATEIFADLVTGPMEIAGTGHAAPLR